MAEAIQAADKFSELQQSSQALLAEFEAKRQRLCEHMASSGLAAVQLQRTENIAWLTAGRVDRRVLLPSPLGIATILVLRDGDAFYLAPDNEGRRLAEEDFAGLPFTAITAPWHAADFAAEIRSLAGDGRIAADTTTEGGALLLGQRASLTHTEVERYRWLGRNTAQVTGSVLQSLQPGVTERTMAARIAGGLLERGIEPSVLLMAADDRILRYMHAVAQNATLKHFGMLNLCSRRWGLSISITRFVHFGPMPQRLVDAFAVAAEVNARLIAATNVDVTSAELFATAADTYASLGHLGEEQRHHQGGATGYSEREWLATPAGKKRVVNMQAFAWNPSVAGGKVEDTVLLLDGAIESLTGTPDLPVVSTRAGDRIVESAGVLVR
ncbi:MAG TPA: M24 family metallopeptidase [Acidobacteriaceae bacterium]|jgi:Xaa-Pro dipeptidase|nr:M24 family metallopeptidase [Acidobacteriaceae bacterium]